MVNASANIPKLTSAEDAEKLRAQQAAEWKDMKAKVALLKKDKKNKSSKAANKAIRQLMEDMGAKHLAELRAAGLANPSETVDAWKLKSRGQAAAQTAVGAPVDADDSMSDV
jgi:Arc/MetJ family transcription regulator